MTASRTPSIAFASALGYFRQRRILAGILITGFCLRGFNIFWGIPIFDELVGRYHPDEWKISAAALQFPQFLWTNTDFRYPTFFHLLNAVLFQPVRIVFHFLLDAGSAEIHNYSTLFARGISVLVGTATIWLCYRLGAELMSRSTGLVAAALYSVSIFPVLNAGYATNDVMTSFFLGLLMLLLTRLYTDHRVRRSYVLCGITFGLLVGTKYTGGIALLMILMSYGWILRSLVGSADTSEYRQAALTVTRNYFLMGAAAVVAFIATTPGLLVNFRSFVGSLEASSAAQGLHAMRGTSLEVAAEISIDYVIAYGYSITGAFLLSAFFCCMQSRLRDWRGYFLLSGAVLILAYTLFLGRAMSPRYLIIVSPIIVLSIAVAWQIAQDRSKASAVVANVLIGLTLVSSLVHTALGVYSKHGDARTAAAHYIVANVAPGTTVGVSYDSEQYRNAHQWRRPVIDFDDRYLKTDMLDRPEILVTSSEDTLDIEDALLSPYLSDDLVWDDAGPVAWYHGDAPSPRIFAFYKELFAVDSPYRLIAEFTRPVFVDISFPSPDIRVYRRVDTHPSGD